MSAKPGDLPDLDGFLASLDALRETDLLTLAAGWSGADRRAHEDAWTRVVAAAAANGMTDRVRAARQAALDWAIKGTNFPWPDAGYMEDMKLHIRRGAAPALADAAVAIALGDRLDSESADTLLAPWRSLAGASWQAE
jgi:hypothetical protein